MKKLIISATSMLMLIVAACSSDEPTPAPTQPIDTEKVVQSLSGTRSIYEAADIARDAIGMLPQGNSRSGARTFNQENVKYGISRSSSRSIGGDTLMYVFNFDDNQGFAVIATDKKVPPLIAVTELGSYDPEVTPENPGLAIYMDMANNYLKAEKNSIGNLDSIKWEIDTTKPKPFSPGLGGDSELIQYKTVTEEILNVKIEPNYNLKWGQRYPEGVLFGNGLAGCTNIAMGIIMSYFEKPTSMQLTYSGSNNEIINLNWDLLKEHTQSYNYNPFYDNCQVSPYNVHLTLSKFFRQLGELNNSVQYDNGTGTIVGKEINTFNKLGFSASSYSEYTSDKVYAILRNNGKIFASAVSTSEGSGHAFVIDGLHFYEWWSGEYTKLPGEDWKLINDHGIQVSHTNHINWGWNGNGNGFFSCYVFDTSKARLDDPNKPASASYTKVKILPVYCY